MADSKISALTSYTTPLVADLIPIVDTANATTKQISWANLFKSPTLITPTLGVATATSINGLTLTSSTGTFTLTNGKTLTVLKTISLTAADDTGVYTLPTGTKTLVATDVTTLSSLALPESQLTFTDITTNNASTTKHGFAPKYPNDATKYLDGTGSYSVPTASATPSMILSTSFEASARHTNAGSGTLTIGVTGAEIESSASANNYKTVDYNLGGSTNSKWFSAGTTFSCHVQFNLIPATAGQYYFGIGGITPGGTAFTFTDDHVGFKVIVAAGVASLYATNAASATATTSAALTTIASGDSFDFIVNIVSTSSVNYYYRKNGAALSSATNHTTNIPTAGVQTLLFGVNNAGTANNAKCVIGAATISR